MRVASRVVAAVAIGSLAIFPLVLLWMADLETSGIPVIVLAALGAARLATMRNVAPHARLGIAAALGAFCAIAWLGAALGLVKLYPVLVSAGGLGYAIWTLKVPPSAAERFARAWNPAEVFDDRKTAYTRRVTQTWAGFFLLNGTIAAYTALAAPIEVWAVYNGVVSYVLIGLIAGGEYAIRTVVRRRHYATETATVPEG